MDKIQEQIVMQQARKAEALDRIDSLSKAMEDEQKKLSDARAILAGLEFAANVVAEQQQNEKKVEGKNGCKNRK